MTPALTIDLENQGSRDGGESIVAMLKKLVRETDTILVCSVNAGRYYDGFIRKLEEADIPVFRSADTAVSALSHYIEGRLNSTRIRANAGL